MKKVFGARPAQLFIQLYIENLFLTAFALFLAWVIIEMTYDIQIHILEIKAIVQKHYNIGICAAIEKLENILCFLVTINRIC